MEIISTTIDSVKLLKPQIHRDERGIFFEVFRENWFKENIKNVDFVQENYSKSVKGTIRGLHYQLTNPQGKLVRVLKGEVFDVAVDLRESSTTFGKYFSTILSSENNHQLWIPEGFAHGFFVISEIAEFSYKCTNYYSPNAERCIIWNDPDLDIRWPIANNDKLSISNKDLSGCLLVEADIYE